MVLRQIDKHCDKSVLHPNILHQVCAHHAQPGQTIYDPPEALTDYLYRGGLLALTRGLDHFHHPRSVKTQIHSLLTLRRDHLWSISSFLIDEVSDRLKLSSAKTGEVSNAL